MGEGCARSEDQHRRLISVRLMEYTQRDCVAGHTMGDNSTSSGMTDGERGKGVGKPLANVLADFVCGLQFCSLPSAAVQVAMNGIIDCIGVTVAGSHEQPVQILRRGLAASAPQGEATILGSKGGMRTSAAEAAWINGTAGHVLDYDDVARGHPSVVIVPAVLAEAEALDAGGTDILTAYVAGYEVWMELMLRERGSYQMKGLHHTPIIGALAAAAACAKLRHLSAKQTMHALGIAAAQASGIVASHGTMAKSFQVVTCQRQPAVSPCITYFFAFQHRPAVKINPHLIMHGSPRKVRIIVLIGQYPHLAHQFLNITSAHKFVVNLLQAHVAGNQR